MPSLAKGFFAVHSPVHFSFRLNQERAIEKERQQQHLDYLKESNQTQIATLTSKSFGEKLALRSLLDRHNEQVKSLNADWQAKLDDVIEKTSLDIKIEREKFDQKVEKLKLSLERENIEKLSILEAQLRDRVKQERDAEIERAVDRIGEFLLQLPELKQNSLEKEVENVRTQADSASQSRVRRIQEKMQSEIDLAEENEKEAMKKYTDAKAKSNQLAEELIAEKHKANLLAGELNEKDQRLHKLMSER